MSSVTVNLNLIASLYNHNNEPAYINSDSKFLHASPLLQNIEVILDLENRTASVPPIELGNMRVVATWPKDESPLITIYVPKNLEFINSSGIQQNFKMHNDNSFPVLAKHDNPINPINFEGFKVFDSEILKEKIRPHRPGIFTIPISTTSNNSIINLSLLLPIDDSRKHSEPTLSSRLNVVRESERKESARNADERSAA